MTQPSPSVTAEPCSARGTPLGADIDFRFNWPRLLRWFVVAACLVVGLDIASSRSGHAVAFSRSESATPAVYLVSPGDGHLRRGEFVYMTTPPNPYHDATVIKRVRGVEGDRLEVDGHVVRINGSEVGRAKPAGRRGEVLTPIASGIIPEGYIYVAGTHRDSFDSRYAEFGLVPVELVEGEADALF